MSILPKILTLSCFLFSGAYREEGAKKRKRAQSEVNATELLHRGVPHWRYFVTLFRRDAKISNYITDIGQIQKNH